MATLAIRIDLPPTGALETGAGNPTTPSDDEMAEEQKARQDFLDVLTPYVQSLLARPPHRSGNVVNVQLMGGDVWSRLNHYLLLVTFDIGEQPVADELAALLPAGSHVNAVGSELAPVQEWSQGDA